MSRKEGVLSSPEVQKKLRLEEKNTLEQRKADLVSVLSSPEGRRFFWRLVYDICGLDDEPQVPGADDLTNRNLGRGAVGRALLNDAYDHALELYIRAFNEHAERALAARNYRAAVTTEEDDG